MANDQPQTAQRRIFINAFDMFATSHLSFGQWRRPEDRGKNKGHDLTYWTDLAKLLERGGVTSLFLADGYGVADTYGGSADVAIRTATQFPKGDPSVPISAMAAVTKNLGFAITTSTSFENPFVIAKRFSTLDHLTSGRIGWNIVTSFQTAAAKAMGFELVEHDQRYKNADEYLEILYKIWEGSWADDALKEDAVSGVYADPSRIRTIHHHGEKYRTDSVHIVDPSPQRTPLLFQAGTSDAGIAFAAKHAEGVFVSAPSPHILAPRVAAIRAQAEKNGRDPRSIKVFASITPIVGTTEAEAQAKYKRALEYADELAGLVFFSNGSGIDLSRLDLDKVLTPEDVTSHGRVHSHLDQIKYQGDDIPPWTPRNVGKSVSLGANGPTPVGTPAQIADYLESWVDVADIDGFNYGYVVSPGSFEDLVDLVIPELRRRGRYPLEPETGTLRERIYGPGHAKLPDDHVGSTWKYERYPEEDKT
ncbi:Nitrilotriacetate monooxygenase component A/pristinamycin IIA synthase subunit A [Niveomyces insectorum RCEF 264]|uniref:Nitrilotriacetate monooxygenase component A/pristinamycin IIA synthase subunit A n=1 Tax=Niveomyces insectorum RCEF 264 TaxID=1081102 RepID=A0A168ACT7_9HYPO|nr:Nitrilotriacetate monooxygenase component A/pristinamycin IIA synthase subunit A [Niveomyces insectorum RCEF 264]